MSKKIRKGDQIVVIAGNDKGKTGVVLTKLKNERVLVQGINIRKKHLRPTQEAQAGRIVEIERPIHISNVALCGKDGQMFKGVAVRTDEQGNRELVYGKGNKKTVYRPIKKPA